MECLILLLLTVIPLLPAIYGKNYSGSREPNCILAQPIIPKLMTKLNNQQVFGNIFEVFCIQQTKLIGLVATPS